MHIAMYIYESQQTLSVKDILSSYGNIFLITIYDIYDT